MAGKPRWPVFAATADPDVRPGADPRVLAARWARLWHSLGLRGDGGALAQALIGAWSEPQRHYHNTEHLAECLALFDQHPELPQRPAELEWAIWLHDAVYDPRRDDNETESAFWSETLLRQSGADSERIERIRRLILSTMHTAAAPQTHDERVLADIDLAILGSSRTRYDRFEIDIRREYAHLPLKAFVRGRRQVILQFSRRTPLFQTAELRRTLEAPARRNLRRSLRPWRFLIWMDKPAPSPEALET